MANVKFLGACIVLAAVMVSGALIYHAQRTTNVASEIGRYQFQPSNPPGVIWTIDTVTGEVKTRNG